MDNGNDTLIRHWRIPSRYGCEKTIMQYIHTELSSVPGALPRLQDMLTAVAEACLNAMEHGNKLNPALTVSTDMLVRKESIVFRVCDQGAGFKPESLATGNPYEEEDPRGWGMLLISRLADEVRVYHDEGPFCIELQFTM